MQALTDSYNDLHEMIIEDRIASGVAFSSSAL
jgi:hypothetical protein